MHEEEKKIIIMTDNRVRTMITMENNAFDRRGGGRGMNSRCSCSCTLHRRLHFRNCKGLGRFYLTPAHQDRAPFTLCVRRPRVNLQFATIVSGSVFIRVAKQYRKGSTLHHFFHYQNYYYFFSAFFKKKKKRAKTYTSNYYYTVGDKCRTQRRR